MIDKSRLRLALAIVVLMAAGSTATPASAQRDQRHRDCEILGNCPQGTTPRVTQFGSIAVAKYGGHFHGWAGSYNWGTRDEAEKAAFASCIANFRGYDCQVVWDFWDNSAAIVRFPTPNGIWWQIGWGNTVDAAVREAMRRMRERGAQAGTPIQIGWVRNSVSRVTPGYPDQNWGEYAGRLE